MFAIILYKFLNFECAQINSQSTFLFTRKLEIEPVAQKAANIAAFLVEDEKIAILRGNRKGKFNYRQSKTLI